MEAVNNEAAEARARAEKETAEAVEARAKAEKE